MPNLAECLAKNLEAARLKLGLKRIELAERAGVSQSKMTRYLDGKQKPNIETIERLAEGLGMQPWELLQPPGAAHTPDPALAPISDIVKLLQAYEAAPEWARADALNSLVNHEKIDRARTQAMQALHEGLIRMGQITLDTHAPKKKPSRSGA